MSKISLFLKGIVIGAASLGVPGLSASTIAIVLLVYYDMIYAISHILKKPKQSISFLLVLLAGYGIGCLAGAWAVNALYELYPFVLGGHPFEEMLNPDKVMPSGKACGKSILTGSVFPKTELKQKKTLRVSDFASAMTSFLLI